jgi:hypothetical protein
MGWRSRRAYVEPEGAAQGDSGSVFDDDQLFAARSKCPEAHLATTPAQGYVRAVNIEALTLSGRG